VTPPVSLINPISVRAFNALYWRKLGFRRRSSRIGSYENVFFPLDSVAKLNRVYGPNGYYHFQCVVSPANARDAVAELLHLTAVSKQGSFVTGLKAFGARPSPGLMSFPLAGTSIAFDILNRGPTTHQFLARLEQVVVEAGGRLYPAKDATMSMQTFQQGYPRLDTFLTQLDPKFSSAFARRVALVRSEG
jgi:FAD/FMN-containing dehydrogenase